MMPDTMIDKYRSDGGKESKKDGRRERGGDRVGTKDVPFECKIKGPKI